MDYKSSKFNVWKAILVGFVFCAIYAPISLSVPSLVTSALSYVPGNWIQNGIHVFSWLYSSILIAKISELGLVNFNDCFAGNVNETLKVVVAGHKGGTVFSTILAWEMINHCGISAGMGTAVSDEWPAPADNPLQYEVDLLLAVAAADRWEEVLEHPFNAQKTLQCVVMTRNPFARFLSLYKYTRDGGESGLLKYSHDLMKLESIEERVHYVWSEFGQQVISQNHVFLKQSLERGCTQIEVDRIFRGGNQFDEEIQKLFRALGVNDENLPELTKRMQVHDISRQSEEQKAANNHISGRNLEAGEEEAAKQIIRRNSSIAKVLLQQCRDLHYDCSSNIGFMN